MYRGNGRGGFLTGTGEAIGAGWGGFTALLAPGDFSGDGKPDLLARQPDGALLLYRGNGDERLHGAAGSDRRRLGRLHRAAGAGRLERRRQARRARARVGRRAAACTAATAPAAGSPAAAEQIGAGWAGFTALTSRGDFSGDGNPDILARASDGALLLYRGNGRGGFITPYPQVGAGWQSLTYITLIGQAPAPARAAAGGAAERAGPRRPRAPQRRRSLHAARRPAARQPQVRKRKGHPRPRVARVVFFVRNGPRRVDRRKPYAARLRLRRPAGQKGRVYARVYFRRAGTKKLRKKTVARRYVMCG